MRHSDICRVAAYSAVTAPALIAFCVPSDMSIPGGQIVSCQSQRLVSTVVLFVDLLSDGIDELKLRLFALFFLVLFESCKSLLG